MKTWIEKELFPTFVEAFARKTIGSVFEGAKIEKTGEHRQTSREDGLRYVTIEIEITCDITRHVDIPGHSFLGMATFENGQTLYSSFSDTDLNEIKGITADRCDVCHVRHNRVKVFVLKNNQSSEIVVVGGSCSKKFKEINLEMISSGILKGFEILLSSISEDREMMKVYHQGNLAREISIGEHVISKLGYTSKAQAEIKGSSSTASEIEFIVANPRKSSLTPEDWQTVWQREQELTSSQFYEHIEYFTRKQNERPSDFNSNCLAVLKGNITGKNGFTAWIANVRNVKIQEANTQSETRGLSIETGKMMNLGEFKIINKKYTQDIFYGNSYYGITAVNSTGEKIWFKFSKDLEVGQTLNIRGKVSENKKELSFVKNVKIL